MKQRDALFISILSSRLEVPADDFKHHGTRRLFNLSDLPGIFVLPWTFLVFRSQFPALYTDQEVSVIFIPTARDTGLISCHHD